MIFNGFISYSHAADGQLAPAVQRGLHRLAKPWHRRRALWIFRDQTGLAVTPTLWSSIQTALDGSDYFVLLASPEAARSPWVNREIEHWVATKSADRILPVVTDGEWQWDQAQHDFAGDSTAVPAALRGVFAEEPLYLDLRWARDDQHLSLRHSRFRDAIAQLAAPMHGVSKDDLEGEDVRQHRRAAWLRWAAVTSLFLLALAASITGALAVHNAAQANASAAEARKQQQVAVEQRGSATRFADEARRQEDLARQQQARATEAASEADRQEGLVRQQKALVQQTSAEVGFQLAKADRAATRAREQERLAQRAGALASESAREMRRQEQRARTQEQIAQEQQRLAAQAATDARDEQQKAKAAAEEAARQKANADRQKANADQQQRIAIGRRLINQAGETISDDPQTAVRLGVAAQRINPDAETRREVAAMVTSTRHAGSIAEATKVAYGPDGLLATVNNDGTVSLWNAADRSRPVRLATIGTPGPMNYWLAFSRDGHRLAVSLDGTVSLWNVTDPAHPVRAATLPGGPNRYYFGVVFSPDGHTLVTGDRGDPDDDVFDISATLWDVTELAHPVTLSSLTGGNTSAQQIAFSGDGRTLVVDQGNVVVWDVTDRAKPVRRSEIAISDSYSLALSPSDSPLLAVGQSLGKLSLYDLTNPAKPQLEFRLTTNTNLVLSLDFNSDGRRLASGDSDGTTIVWDLTGPYPRDVTRLASHTRVNSLGFSPDGGTLATADGAETVVLWTVDEFAAPRRRADVPAHDGQLVGLSYAADGRSVTTAGEDGKAIVWDVADPAKPVRRATVALPGTSALISPDGRTVATVADDEKVVTLTDLADPDSPATLAEITPGLPYVSAAAFSPNGRTLVINGRTDSIGGQRQIQVWDLTDRTRPTRLATIPDMSAIIFSPDGRTLATYRLDTVSLWDLTNRAAPKQLSTLVGSGDVLAMAFSPDGHTLATGDYDRTVLLWDITDRTKPRRLAALAGHAYRVTALAFSRDGHTLATADMNSWAIVWDVAQPTKPVRLATVALDQYSTPKAMAFSTDGNTLALGTDEGWDSSRLGLWDVTALNSLRADPAQLGCTIAGRGLDADEWARFVPELPYRETCSG